MSTPGPQPVDILVVDDNPAKLLALEVALGPLGQNLVPATSGEDALRLLMHRRFATIVLDVNMPGLDGFQTAQMIRARPSSARTPIIFVSAVNLEPADALRGYGLGAVDYIVAPVLPEVLRAKVSVFVDLFRATEELERLNSEARTTLAAIVESSQDAIVSKTLAGVITSWNAGAARLYGYTPEEAIGRSFALVIPPELHEQERVILERVRRGERVEPFDTVRVAKGGGRVDVSVIVSPLRDHYGRVIGASNVTRDVTARKRSEQALRDSEQRFRTLADASPSLIWFDDPAGECRYVNRRFVEFVGRPESEITGSKWQPLLHPDDGPAYVREFFQAQRERKPFQARVRIRRHDGVWRWIESHALPYLSSTGEYLGHVGASPDVTEAVEAEAALRDSEQRYRHLVHALPAAVYTCDREGRITLYNDAAVELWGRRPEVGRDLWCGSWKIFQPDGTPLPLDACPMARTLTQGRAIRGEEIVIERPDGTRRHVLAHPEPVFDASGNVAGAINMLVDITDLREAERGMRESEARLRALADNIPQLAWMADERGTAFWYNRRWHEYTGLSLEESQGWNWTTALHPDQAAAIVERVKASFDRGEPLEDTFLIRAKDGAYRWFLCRAFPLKDDRGRVVRWFGTSTDVTEQREAQQVLARDRETLERLVAARTTELEQSNERLRLSERFAAIGTLAAGLGHDMGNLLLPVRFHLESITGRSGSPEVAHDVSAILKCTEYLQKLAHGLRMLALDNEDDRASSTQTDMATWWANTAPVLRGCLPRGTVLEDDINAPDAVVRIPEHQLSQAVFNIVQNAGDALRGRTGGVVRVAARRDGASLRLQISDDGPGMPEDVRRRCFEPFFTTKTRSMSTGLGLSLVRTLVTRAGGSVQVESRPGRGTTFTLTLPSGSVPEAAAEPKGVAAVSHSDPRLAGYIGAVLHSFGYRARVGTEDPEEASIWVVEAPRADSAAIRKYCGADPDRRVVVVGGGSAEPGSTIAADRDRGPSPSQVSWTGPDVSPVVIREALRVAVLSRKGQPDDATDPHPVRGRQRTDRRGDPAEAGARA